MSGIVRNLRLAPYPSNSCREPLPKNAQQIIPFDWAFYKLRLTTEIFSGASGQIRIMYFISEHLRVIKPVWIYNHKQYPKRPPHDDLFAVIKELFIEDS